MSQQSRARKREMISNIDQQDCQSSSAQTLSAKLRKKMVNSEINTETSSKIKLKQKEISSKLKVSKKKSNKYNDLSISKHLNSDDENDSLKLSNKINFLDKFETKTENKCTFEKTDFSCNFDKRHSEYHFRPSISTNFEKSLNLFHLLYKTTCGIHVQPKFKKSFTQPLIKEISEFGLFRCATPFDRRTTALEWHPTHQNTLAMGSKGGDIILWNSSTVDKDPFIHGDGPGGSIQAIKFWPWDHNRVLTASINGTVTLHDFEGRQTQVLSDTMNCMDFWYCSVDVSQDNKMVITGDNVGKVLTLTDQGEKISNLKLHKQKVTHVEFSPRESWLLCTASVDHTVKLWDIRMIKDIKSSLNVLQHAKGVNSAYFSSTDGCRLLTTDQHSEIKIFSAPDWRLDKTIVHPHRFFQHITPIKATWHPLQDLIVVGRYPDPSLMKVSSAYERRAIDIIDSDTGGIICKLYDPSAPGIVSLNKFNHSGDALASGMGVNILLWNRKHLIARKQEELSSKMISSGITPNRNQPHSDNNNNIRLKKTEKKTKSENKTAKSKLVKKTKIIEKKRK